MSIPLGAHADEPRPRAVLTYERGPGAESCPNEPSLRRSVAAHLGYDPFVSEASLRVLARIVATRRGLLGTVEAREGDEVVGQREIPSPTADCVELARALALAISVAVDPFSLTRGAGDPVEPIDPVDPVDPQNPPVDPLVDPLPVDPVAPVIPTVDAEPARGPRLGVGAGVGIGSVPAVRPFVSAYVGFAGAHYALRLDIRFDMPASADGEVRGEVSASAFSTRAYGCARVRIFEPCAGVGAQVLFAKGSGVDQPQDATFASPIVSLASFVRVPSEGRFGASFVLGLDFPIRRPRLRIGLEPAWTMPPVLGFIGVAFDIRP